MNEGGQQLRNFGNTRSRVMGGGEVRDFRESNKVKERQLLLTAFLKLSKCQAPSQDVLNVLRQIKATSLSLGYEVKFDVVTPEEVVYYERGI